MSPEKTTLGLTDGNPVEQRKPGIIAVPYNERLITASCSLGSLVAQANMERQKAGRPPLNSRTVYRNNPDCFPEVLVFRTKTWHVTEGQRKDYYYYLYRVPKDKIVGVMAALVNFGGSGKDYASDLNHDYTSPEVLGNSISISLLLNEVNSIRAREGKLPLGRQDSAIKAQLATALGRANVARISKSEIEIAKQVLVNMEGRGFDHTPEQAAVYCREVLYPDLARRFKQEFEGKVPDQEQVITWASKRLYAFLSDKLPLDEIEDGVQEVLMNLIPYITGRNVINLSLVGLLYQTARNYATDDYRTVKDHLSIEQMIEANGDWAAPQEFGTPSNLDAVELVMDWPELYRKAKLSPFEEQVLRLSMQGFDTREIAELLSKSKPSKDEEEEAISDVSVRASLDRARGKFETVIGRYLGTDRF